MDQIESSAHSFIIKVWREENDRPAWRGHITHVPSGERRYLQELNGIIAFIIPYLREMGINARNRGFLNRWIKKQWKRRKDQVG
ncbi:MAG: hypothetical protein GY803_30000 [Chloroflexi bacterium]|nr:hypothetical protein [Chloroflexota bacterium]